MSECSEVGTIKKVFKPGIANMSAGIILGLLLIGGGVFGLIMSTKAVIENRGNFPQGAGEWNWASVIMVWIASISAIPGGWYLIKWMRTLMSLKVEFGGLGLLLTERAGQRTILWDDIELMEEHHSIEPKKYGLPPTVSKSYVVIPRGGEPFSFEENAIKDHIQLASMIRAETVRRSIPWNIVEHRI